MLILIPVLGIVVPFVLFGVFLIIMDIKADRKEKMQGNNPTN